MDRPLKFFLTSITALHIFYSGAEVIKDPSVLNVHVVPHTHDDVGWLKTIDQYYYGTNNTIQHANVNSIITNVVNELKTHPERTFTYVEMKFFHMWWIDQTPHVQNEVIDLVKSGQLNFANGGWCMHDEATTHFMGMIDQTTLGHTFLKNTFDYIPSIGWQLDPFGHSATQSSLLTSGVGFNALFFGRIDYQDLEKRRNEKRCEGVWSSSPSLGTNVFWGLTGSYGGNYGAPESFCFDTLCGDEPIVSNERSAEYNLDRKAREFVDVMITQAAQTRGNNIMLTMGSDFQYENAYESFRSMDALWEGISSFQNAGKLENALGHFKSINIFYSSPEKYARAKYDENILWEVKSDDFMPYSDCKHCFWTGYFTSRASLKRLERAGSSFLHAARQIEAMDDDTDKLMSNTESDIFDLDDAMGVIQHHDGVTGTSKQHVAYDYAKRVTRGFQRASTYAAKVLGRLLGNPDIELKTCPELNVSKCDISQESTLELGTDIFIVAYNALASSRSDVVGVPVSIDASYRVWNLMTNAEVDSILLPRDNSAGVANSSNFVLYFDTGDIPAIGGVSYRIEMVEGIPSAISSTAKSSSSGLRSSEDSLIVNNGDFSIYVDRSTGALERISRDNVAMDINVEWGFYHSYHERLDDVNDGPQPQGGDSTMGTGQCIPGYIDYEGDERKWLLGDNSLQFQNSGAYIFRPQESDEEPTLVDQVVEDVQIYESPLITEIRTQFSSWVTQTTRIKRGQPYVEIEFTIGPVPAQGSEGREVIARYQSSVNNGKVFYTDSNARDFIKREVGKRNTWDLDEYQPVAGNYYPINAAIYIEDEDSSLAVLNDRSQGGASLNNGVIEIMVQRRTKADDHRGVDEPLDETDGGMNHYPPYGDKQRLGNGVIISGTHRILMGGGFEGAKVARSNMDPAFSPLQLFFGSQPGGSDVINTPFQATYFSNVRRQLPSNVMLVTFSRVYGSSNEFLIRLAHQYAVGEDDIFSTPVAVDISDLFARHSVVSFAEKTLSANQDRASWEAKKFLWNNEDDRKPSFERALEDGTVVQLNPLEIRTFIVTVTSSKINDQSSLQEREAISQIIALE